LVDNGADAAHAVGSATVDPKLARHIQPAACSNTTTCPQLIGETGLSKIGIV